MKRPPIISILVPVYNVETYLSTCLNSILSQIYTNLQIVLIDDGSKDNSLSVCQEYANTDRRIEVYHQENQGVAATRNNLLEKVKGDYVLFIDSDDWIETDMVDHLLSLGIQKDADIVMCDRVINDAQPLQTDSKVIELNQEQAIEDFLHHQYFVGSLWNKLIKQSLLQDLTFKCGISYGEDALFCWQLLKRTKIIVVSNKQLYHYRMNASSLSHTFNGHQFSAYYVWDQIVNDVRVYFPQHLSLAQAQFCNQMTVILYYAARNGYKRDERVDELCKTIKTYRKQMKEQGCSFQKYFFATIVAFHYSTIRSIFYIQRKIHKITRFAFQNVTLPLQR